MSGGAFEYKQFNIKQISEEIEYELDNQGKEKSKEEQWMSNEYYEKFPEEKFNVTYSKEIQEHFKDAIETLNIAYIYAQRIDRLLSGDDGYESFLSRLKEELNQNKEDE